MKAAPRARPCLQPTRHDTLHSFDNVLDVMRAFFDFGCEEHASSNDENGVGASKAVSVVPDGRRVGRRVVSEPKLEDTEHTEYKKLTENSIVESRRAQLR